MESEAERTNRLLIKCIKFEKTRLAELKTNKKVSEDKREVALKHKILEKLKNTNMPTLGVPINIQLFIEKAMESRGPFSFSCYPTWTIYTTKEVVQERFNFSMECQNIIVGHAIAKEHKTLHDYGIKKASDVLYVYVSKPKQSTNEDHLVLLDDKISDEDLGKNSIRNTDYVENVNTEYLFEPEENPIVLADFTVNSNVNTDISNKQPESTSHQSLSVSVNELLSMKSECNDPEPLQSKVEGWICEKCTSINEPTRPGCLMCSASRPEDYQPPPNYVPSLAEKSRINEEKRADEALKLEQQKQEENRFLNYEQHQSAMRQSISLSPDSIDCAICLNTIKPGEAVQLKECLHAFCKNCIRQHAIMSEDAMVKCPFVDDNYACQYYLQEREIRELLNPEEFKKYLKKGLSIAEKQMKNSYHCATPDCNGWCLYDDGVNTFLCPACKTVNCLTCKAVHKNMNCVEYQKDLASRALTDDDARKTNDMLQQMLSSDDAMHCPQCNIIILRKSGCDWIRCTMCKLEICWVTKGRRWGPNGKNDISGGCRCRVNNKKCHPDCVNCH